MSRPFRPLVLLLGVAALACADRELPQAPSTLDHPPDHGPPRAAPSAEARAQQANLEALARQTALALGQPAFRSSLRQGLASSPIREHKLHFQRYLASPATGAARSIAQASRAPESSIQALARATTPLEMYLPVPAHRSAWDGGPDVLVATALRDGDVPVAFDIHGNRRLLDPLRPPDSPVIALVPVETNFDAGPARATCTLDTCDGDGSGGGTGGSGGGTKPPGTSPTAGLYMTSAHFVQTFEGWLRGNPEFEIHILGQSGDTDSLRTYQCAGEKATGPYLYDQNALNWTGNVLLFTQGQIDTYQIEHPGKNLRVFAVEDDDTPCEIRVEPDEFTELIGSLPGLLRDLSGGTSSQQGLQRIWKAAPAILRLIRALASFLHSDDDLVGNAIEDVVAGEFHPGANWIVKGHDSATNGWLTLTMH